MFVSVSVYIYIDICICVYIYIYIYTHTSIYRQYICIYIESLNASAKQNLNFVIIYLISESY